ncbi:MAG: helix-turn-helix domain-containing protein, partial [Candidatus Promineofilum sp.]|nr:helix-turn-helix domain-containing protein [Promineifilum sp.]
MRHALTLPDTFGASLRFLRKRAQLTQDELGRAVGYSREQIARLENGSRLPDLAVVAALFVPALLPERDRALTEQFLALAGRTRRDVQLTVTRTQETRIELVETTAVAPSPRYAPPAPLLPLLGRQADVAELLARLRTARLITLIGAPGIGKTRLALEVGHAARAGFGDGAAFVSLAEAQTAADIPYAVLQALSLTPAAGQSPADALCDALRPRQLLLILDNCEHLLDGATLFADWLADAPDLRLLCTSRVPLDLYGEHEWPLAPLAVPDLAEPPDLTRWGQLPALQLLAARATATDPDFALTDDNLLPLASLCVALDGLPLALELAAVRLRELSPQELVQQLLALRGHAQLSSTWLGQTRRNVAERHRTLQAAIGWSAQLLDPARRAAFHALGVFVGGGTADAALEVAGADAATLAHLARANLVRLDGDRVHLLETLRAFAREQLADDRLAATQTAHAATYARFALRVFAGLNGEEQTAWMARAVADHDNCLAALRWALAAGDGETAVAIAGGLWWFWYRRGYFALGRELLAAALEWPSSDPLIRANALNGLAAFYLVDEAYAANLACHEEGLALRRALGDPAGIATVLHNMGLTAYTMGDTDTATARLLESIEVNPGGDQTSAWAHLGLIAQERHDLVAARRWLELAYDAAMAASAGWIQAFVMNFLADVLRELGELDAADRLAQESLRLFAAMDDTYYLPDTQVTLAQIALDRGDTTAATALAGLAAAQYAARDDAVLLASVTLVQAEIAGRDGQREAGAALLARSQALRRRASRAVSPHEQAQ